MSAVLIWAFCVPRSWLGRERLGSFLLSGRAAAVI